MGPERYFHCCQLIDLGKLELFGRGYVAARCLDVLEREREERLYRAYVTDALSLIAENSARACGGRYLTQRWRELLRQEEAAGETRSAEEIARETLGRAGVVWVES